MARGTSPTPWLIAGVLLLIVAGLGAFGIALIGNPRGLHGLPDPATGSTVEFLIDPAATFTWDDVRTRPEPAWQSWDGQGYVHGTPGEALWVRITLRNPADTVLRGILAEAEIHTDHLDFWTRDADEPGGWRTGRSGEWIPPREKSLAGRDSAFFVRVPAHGAQTVYVRVQDRFGGWFKPTWWPDERAFLAAQLHNTVADALYFGILLALFVYNGVLWARLRHRDLGYYLGYVAGFGLFMFFARSEASVIGLTVGSPVMEIFISLALAASGGCQILFAREFLGLPALAPRLDRLTRALGWLILVLGVGGLAFPWFQTSTWLHVCVGCTALAQPVLVIGGLLAWRAGALHARFFVLSFGLFFLGVMPLSLSWLLAIPVGASPFALMLGSALEMMLLSLALADRFARLQSERHAAQLAEESARLEMLRYQLNPHFLFNALNSIYGLVLPHSRPAGDLVRRLADFCRGTFARDLRESRPLGEELAMVRSYLDIEQARWRDRLLVEYDFDPSADGFLLPPFLLLPLVDNAIKHGGATSPGLLTLRLATRRAAAGAVTLTLINSGAWAASGATPRADSTGVGLANIRERLRRAFGPGYELTTAPADGWVTLTLRLPPRPAITPA